MMSLPEMIINNITTISKEFSLQVLKRCFKNHRSKNLTNRIYQKFWTILKNKKGDKLFYAYRLLLVNIFFLTLLKSVPYNIEGRHRWQYYKPTQKLKHQDAL